jgi:hypothetical protein
MSTFIQIEGGELNLSFVAGTQHHFRKTKDGRCYKAISFYDAQKRLLGHIEHADGIDLEEITAPVVPAAPGVVAAVLHTMTSDDNLGGCPEEIYVELLPIVAWRLLPERAVPVLLDETSPTSIILLMMPDGRWLEPGDSSYATLDEAETALLKRAQADWHRKRALGTVRQKALAPAEGAR